MKKGSREGEVARGGKRPGVWTGMTPKIEQEIARPPQQQQQRSASEVKERKRKAAKTMVTMERCEAMRAKYAKKAVPHPLGIATQLVPRP